MARLVKHERNRPFTFRKDEVDQDTIAICACGLSDDKPFCDGSHKSTQEEQQGQVYIYSEDESSLMMPAEY